MHVHVWWYNQVRVACNACHNNASNVPRGAAPDIDEARLEHDTTHDSQPINI